MVFREGSSNTAEFISGRQPDHIIDVLTQGLPIEFLRPNKFIFVAQGRIKESDSTPLVGDGMGYCMVLIEKGNDPLTTFTHVEGGGIDGSVQRTVKNFANANDNTRSIIFRSTGAYPGTQLEEQMLNMGIDCETVSVDVGDHHYAVAYKPDTGEVLFQDELRGKVYVFNWS